MPETGVGRTPNLAAEARDARQTAPAHFGHHLLELPHFLHHLLHLGKAIEHVVHFGDGGATAFGDSLPAFGVQDGGRFALAGCHRADNSLHATKIAFAFAEIGVFDHFEKAWYSHVINKRKPDVAAFQYVIRDSNLDPAATLFIDDALVNVEGARSAGLQAIHLAPGKTVLDLGL